jgi:hypothetical protein
VVPGFLSLSLVNALRTWVFFRQHRFCGPCPPRLQQIGIASSSAQARGLFFSSLISPCSLKYTGSPDHALTVFAMNFKPRFCECQEFYSGPAGGDAVLSGGKMSAEPPKKRCVTEIQSMLSAFHHERWGAP